MPALGGTPPWGSQKVWVPGHPSGVLKRSLVWTHPLPPPSLSLRPGRGARFGVRVGQKGIRSHYIKWNTKTNVKRVCGPHRHEADQNGRCGDPPRLNHVPAVSSLGVCGHPRNSNIYAPNVHSNARRASFLVVHPPPPVVSSDFFYCLLSADIQKALSGIPLYPSPLSKD